MEHIKAPPELVLTTVDGNLAERWLESSPKHDTEFGRDEVFVNLKLCQVSVKFKVDTGSQANMIPLKTVQKLRPTVKVEKSKVTLTSYTGDKIPVAGRCVIPYKDSQLDFYVTDSTHTPLLGFRSSQDLKIIKVVLTTNTERKDPVDMYPKLFEGLGCLKESYKIQIDESVTPVVNAPRNVPEALRGRLKDALSEMERDGIIEKVDQPTDWVSSLVVVEKPSGKLRVCLDPRNLKVAIKREHYQLPTIEDIVSRMSNAKYFSKLDANYGYWQTEVSYVGHRLTQQGVHPDPSKIEAVKDMPQPIDKKGVERLLGFVNYLSKVIPNMSTVTEPIRRLLKSDVEFEWTKPQEEAFKEIKKDHHQETGTEVL
ncbi:uncharacterized protein LOC110460854 [Mizuhopecten yessoensis]|uniref:uncharacterized protein LOC110460854 n=1 Tax=Mizuhopecten yessoensis TaxID=6573 RepID=UPI000B457840|nr:uncharacterized protein LOC110460854 [Mizuhopecten yessoensis]